MLYEQNTRLVPILMCSKRTNGVCSGVVGWGTDLQARRSRVRFPMVIFDISFRPHYGPVDDSDSNRNEYQKYFLGVREAGESGWQPYHLHVPIVLKSRSFNLLETSGPVQVCNGIEKKKRINSHGSAVVRTILGLREILYNLRGCSILKIILWVTANHILTKQQERYVLSSYTEHYRSVTQNYHPHTIQTHQMPNAFVFPFH